MVDHHFAERKLPGWGKNTFVHWSRKPKGKAVVFIHGFGGDSADTFPDFNSLFRTSAKFKGVDVFFYGYYSRSRTIGSNSSEFSDLLQKLSKDSSSLFSYNSNMQAERRPNAKNIIIVAHSIGAIIFRRALLDAYKQNLKWVNNCSLILFAPAHNGSSLTISKLVDGKGLPGLLELVSVVIPFFMPVLEEIRAGKPFIQKLETDTLDCINKGKTKFTIARKVVWAATERIVVHQYFGKDPPPITIPNTTHTTVCKPTLRFLKPFELVVDNI